MAKSNTQLILEVVEQYGSVGKMIATVNNRVHSLREFGGHKGRDGADTLEVALRDIPRRYHSIYYKYAHTIPTP